MLSCLDLIVFLALRELEPHSHPLFYDSNSKDLQCETQHLAISSLKSILLPQHSARSHPTAAASPDGPALFLPTFEM